MDECHHRNLRGENTPEAHHCLSCCCSIDILASGLCPRSKNDVSYAARTTLLKCADSAQAHAYAHRATLPPRCAALPPGQPCTKRTVRAGAPALISPTEMRRSAILQPMHAPCVHHSQASSTRCTVPMMCCSGAVPYIPVVYCHPCNPCAMRTTSRLELCVACVRIACLSWFTSAGCEAYKVRHCGVPAANSMHNAGENNPPRAKRADQRRKLVCPTKDPERRQARALRCARPRPRAESESGHTEFSP